MKRKGKLLRNSKGEYNYHFNWVGGGFNDVWALNKADALRKVREKFSLTPDPKSFRKADAGLRDRMDWIGRFMTC